MPHSYVYNSLSSDAKKMVFKEDEEGIYKVFLGDKEIDSTVDLKSLQKIFSFLPKKDQPRELSLSFLYLLVGKSMQLIETPDQIHVAKEEFELSEISTPKIQSQVLKFYARRENIPYRIEIKGKASEAIFSLLPRKT